MNQLIALPVSVQGGSGIGTAKYLDSGTEIGSAVVTGGSATLTMQLSPGVHSLTAQYMGDAGSAPSASQVQQLAISAGQAQQDFDGDGKGDLLWHDPSTRSVSSWAMNGAQVVQTGSFGQAETGFELLASGDFDGDGKSDLLWFRDSDRTLKVQLTGGTYQAVGSIDDGWEVRAIGDFNGDGKSDVLLYSPQTRAATAWLLNGAQFLGTLQFAAGSDGYEVTGAADFNGDGKADLLCEQPRDTHGVCGG